jgi:hypothetical protein
VHTLEEVDKSLICIGFPPCNQNNILFDHTRILAILIQALSWPSHYHDDGEKEDEEIIIIIIIIIIKKKKKLRSMELLVRTNSSFSHTCMSKVGSSES